MKRYIDKLERTGSLSREEWSTLIRGRTPDISAYLFERAGEIRHQFYGHDIYIRGLIEFTNYCKNDCLYCGIRKSNTKAHRYRLTKEQILDCCQKGHELGFRTFVLQGGEDGYYTDELMADIVQCIRKTFPDCAITLSLGERSKKSYQRLFDAGAERYLLRHETYDSEHYSRLHPKSLSAADRQQCLWDLKDIGYQVGTGFMVGSPFQTPENLADDMLFLKELDPQMVGIGPFIPHHETPFSQNSAGTLELTLFMLGLIRLMLPKVLLPATTALGTIAGNGREKGILAGANVVMPNLSPTDVRKDYLLYDNKICTGDEAAECRMCMENRMNRIGYQVVVDRGDSLNMPSGAVCPDRS
jgi:biotin synthase